METILFLIIVGILSTIFGKSKRNQGQSSKKLFKANGIDDVRTLFKELSNNQHINDKPNKTEQKVEIPEKKLHNLETEYLQVRQESEASRVRMAAKRLPNGEKMKEQTIQSINEEGEAMISKIPEGKTLVNGIIWAEILGEPRAKKPYFAKRG